MSWVYQQDDFGMWMVGFYDPEGEWHMIMEYATQAAAAKRVHYLNGGNYVTEEET